MSGTILARGPAPGGAPLGALLRQWRRTRRMSQLDLALAAEVSSRHLSFVETGRSQPSRGMILRLSEALEIPLRDRNALFTAAGYAPLYRERPLGAPDMAAVRQALERILDQQEPYPAVVQDGAWTMLMLNRAAERLVAALLGAVPPPEAGPANALRLLFDPGGLRPFIDNWDEVARALVRREQRELAHTPNAAAAETLDEVLAYPGVPAAWAAPDAGAAPPPLLTVVLRKDALRLAWFTTLTSFGTPQDVTLQGLRIESFFPADDATERWARAAAGKSGAAAGASPGG